MNSEAAPIPHQYRFFHPHLPLTIEQQTLPHWYQEGVSYFVTFRLEDALPQEKLRPWKAQRDIWMKQHPQPWTPDQAREYGERFSGKIENWLDAGYGCCLLADPANELIVSQTLQYFDGTRYQLGTHTVAANHVHAIVTPLPDFTLRQILHSWKSWSAREINRLAQRVGSLWQSESYDHIIRTPLSAWHIEQYILAHEKKNPS